MNRQYAINTKCTVRLLYIFNIITLFLLLNYQLCAVHSSDNFSSTLSDNVKDISRLSTLSTSKHWLQSFHFWDTHLAIAYDASSKNEVSPRPRRARRSQAGVISSTELIFNQLKEISFTVRGQHCDYRWNVFKVRTVIWHKARVNNKYQTLVVNATAMIWWEPYAPNYYDLGISARH